MGELLGGVLSTLDCGSDELFWVWGSSLPCVIAERFRSTREKWQRWRLGVSGWTALEGVSW